MTPLGTMITAAARALLPLILALAGCISAHPAMAQTQAPSKTQGPAKSNQQPPAPVQAADPVGLLRQLTQLFAAGKYPEAIEVSKQLIAAFDRMGAGEHPLQAANYASLGDLYKFTGQFAEAEKSHRRALAMREKAFGPEHADVAASLAGLHHLAAAQGRYGEAETLLNRALAMRERLLPPGDPELAMTRISVAKLHAQQGRHDAAEPVLRAALDELRKKLGAEHAYVGVAINNLADTLAALGRYGEAEPLLRTAVELTEKATGPSSPLAATALSNLSELYRAQGRYAEAEELRRRELTILEASTGADSLEIARSLNNFGTLLGAQRRSREAEAMLRRALAIQERIYKDGHPDIATALNNLAEVIGQSGNHAEADALFLRSIAAREKAFGTEHRMVAVAIGNLAVSLLEQKRFAEAEAQSRRALAIYEAALPAGHPHLALALNNVAVALDHLGRHGEAQPLLERALLIRSQALGDTHPDVTISQLNLGSNALDRGAWQAAYDTLVMAAEAWRQRQTALAARLRNSDLQSSGDLEQVRGAFLGLSVAAEQLRSQGGDEQRLSAKAFEAVQNSAGSAAATALARAGVRASARNPRLAGLARERQDVAEQYGARDRQYLTALGTPAGERNQVTVDDLRASLATLTARGTALDVTLAREFPDYAALSALQPLQLRETQALLAADEALLVLAPTRFGTLVWAVTRDASKWVRADLTGQQANDRIAVLRCGLDATSWYADNGQKCLKAVGRPAEGGLLPFDTVLAHDLYRTLLGPVEDLINGRRLLVVATDALSTLPLHVLVTKPPPTGTTIAERLRGVAWLGQRQPVTVLPAVASLATGRIRQRGAPAPKPFLAFANPLLLGETGLDRSAFEKQACPGGRTSVIAAVTRRSATAGTAFTGSIDIEVLRRAPPLPETADEVCAVALALGATDTDVYLGARATVGTIKQLAQTGALAGYRVIHFATHGLVAGGSSAIERALADPAILLTPPPSGTVGRALAADNGLLSAPDIAALDLNADWVVMSACNTAAGSATHAEPLAGLARAFFHAGARALLVSHWEVDSAAAVKLTTGAFDALARDPRLSKAAALQASMVALLASTDPRETHPTYWAPFVVVGESGGPH
jgi:CHAT domain-containing protein/tetratricopeptide (TPR) repeat protein